MKGMKLISTVRLENILSYGPNAEPFPLEPLNVLIGPNASGKSNLLEALSLLSAAPRDLQEPIRSGGGVGSWIWKGAPPRTTATLDVTLGILDPTLNYRLSFMDNWSHFQLVDEVVTDAPAARNGESQSSYYQYRSGNPYLSVAGDSGPQILNSKDIVHDQSILSQRRDAAFYPQLWEVSTILSYLSFYRELNPGRRSALRYPQKPDSYQLALLEDASNLSLVLSDLLNQPSAKENVLERMKEFYHSFRDINVTVTGGMVQIFFHEGGLHQPIPASRLSDGSLRYLCLLAILCHPNPPAIICIEEPELGLHPDVIPEVAKLLIEASSRSQIFATTHSDILVDALTDVPEAVVVCEKVDGATNLRRLDSAELKPWIEHYRLGELWTRGQIGGNRW